jgi:SAM-dependent methyltransferase
LSILRKLKWKLLPLIKLGFTLIGKNWNHFYSWMINRQERNNTIDNIIKKNKRSIDKNNKCLKGLYDISAGPEILQFIIEEGLTSTDRFFDFGCGYGRVGIPVIRYLNSGNYVGTDISAERIRMAKEYVERENLQNKNSIFFNTPLNNDLSQIAPSSFDFVWSFSVFSHMPFYDVEECLTQLKRIMKKDAMILANYGYSDRIHSTNISAYWVSEDDMIKLVNKLGFDYKEIEDWADRISPDRASYEKMMKLTLSSK